MMMKLKYSLLTILAVALFSCSGGESTKDESAATTATSEAKVEENVVATDPMSDKGIGPVTSVDISADIDPAMAEEGKTIFTTKCTACHKMGKRYIGPDLIGVTERRTPEWIMNMILNPEEMTANNEIAKKLLAEYSAPMANQNLTQEEARKVLEYFRTNN